MFFHFNLIWFEAPIRNDNISKLDPCHTFQHWFLEHIFSTPSSSTPDTTKAHITPNLISKIIYLLTLKWLQTLYGIFKFIISWLTLFQTTHNNHGCGYNVLTKFPCVPTKFKLATAILNNEGFLKCLGFLHTSYWSHLIYLCT